MHVDAHEEEGDFVLTYLKGEGIEEERELAAITKKTGETDAVHYFPTTQADEISEYALTTFYNSKFSDGLEGYNQKRNLTDAGYELLKNNIRTEERDRDILVEEHGVDGAFEALEAGNLQNADQTNTGMTDSQKAARRADHFY